MESEYQQAMKDPDMALRLSREHSYLEASEAICRALNLQGLTKSDLAAKMNQTKPAITRITNGSNITLKSLSDALHHLGYRIERCDMERDVANGWNRYDNRRMQEHRFS